LISDVMMPKLNGLELQQKLAVLHPGLRTILMSGYTATTIDAGSVLNEETLYLTKPFSPKDLLAKVGQLLRHMDRTAGFVPYGKRSRKS
jgi:DNA-binding response OmpR family regulator